MSDEVHLKEVYQEKLQAQLDKLAARIKLLKTKAEEASTESKVKARGRIRKAKERYENAQARIKEYRTASADARQDIQVKVEQAMDDLRDAVDDAINQFG